VDFSSSISPFDAHRCPGHCPALITTSAFRLRAAESCFESARISTGKSEGRTTAAASPDLQWGRVQPRPSADELHARSRFLYAIEYDGRLTTPAMVVTSVAIVAQINWERKCS